VAEPDPGGFRFDPELERYESAVEIDGTRVAVRVASEAFKDLGMLGDVIGVVARGKEHFLGRVVEELLEGKNEDWLRDGEEPLSEQDFRRRLTLDAIEVDPDGDVELLIEDDGMFWGHQIIVNLDSAYRITRVNLEG
jgi:hypothetical protein